MPFHFEKRKLMFGISQIKMNFAPGGMIARASSISDLDNEISGFQGDNILGFKLMLIFLRLSGILGSGQCILQVV